MIRRARDIVVIGGSAGGLVVATAILRGLPAAFPGAVFVALHRRLEPGIMDGLLRTLARKIALPMSSVGDPLPIEFGRVYFAPDDQHIILENGRVRAQDSPTEHRFHPSIDVLFKSAALTYGRRVVGVLLSGYGSDGTAGLWEIRHRGGITIVQDPDSAAFPAMPRSATEHVAVDHVLPLAQIAPKLIELVSAQAAGLNAEPPRILIVEDESVVASNLQQSLMEMGYHVIDWVPTGEAAMKLAETEHPDLILMDIHLGGALDGIETARRISERLQIPIVYCTAHADLETLKAVQTTEGYGYVVKPFQSPAVRAAVELALGRRERELR